MFLRTVPKEIHDKIGLFPNKKLKVTVKSANGGFMIICTPRENVFAFPKTLAQSFAS